MTTGSLEIEEVGMRVSIRRSRAALQGRRGGAEPGTAARDDKTLTLNLHFLSPE
jgi:hypothetical protein